MTVALVLGGAQCVWDDARAALELFQPEAVTAIKRMIADWPTEIHYAVTLHEKATKNWLGLDATLKERARNGYPGTFEVWSHRKMPGATHWTADLGGSSSLLATKIMRMKDFKVVLAGVPMNALPHYANAKLPWTSYDRFRKEWEKRQQELAPFVRSMSGWTREFFGPPTLEWLAQ